VVLARAIWDLREPIAVVVQVDHPLSQPEGFVTKVNFTSIVSSLSIFFSILHEAIDEI
jgi:hypothetical protein